MIIIATMKAASSSFHRAMGDLTGIKVGSLLNEGGVKLDQIYPLDKFYELPCSAGIDVPDHLMEAWNCKDEWHKIHMAPTEHNKKMLKKHNVRSVVLLRDPSKMYDSLRREGRFKAFWRKWSREKMTTNATNFYNGWMKEVNNPDFLFLTFEDVTKNTKEAVERALGFYGFDVTVPDGYELPRLRYKGKGQGGKS